MARVLQIMTCHNNQLCEDFESAKPRAIIGVHGLFSIFKVSNNQRQIIKSLTFELNKIMNQNYYELRKTHNFLETMMLETKI